MLAVNIFPVFSFDSLVPPHILCTSIGMQLKEADGVNNDQLPDAPGVPVPHAHHRIERRLQAKFYCMGHFHVNAFVDHDDVQDFVDDHEFSWEFHCAVNNMFINSILYYGNYNLQKFHEFNEDAQIVRVELCHVFPECYMEINHYFDELFACDGLPRMQGKLRVRAAANALRTKISLIAPFVVVDELNN